MKSLIAFILNHRFGFSFILIELLCFYLIYLQHNYQSSVLFNKGNEVSGKIYSEKNRIYQYINLKQENEQLVFLNAKLLNSSIYAHNIINTLSYVKKDTILKQEYVFIPARIINATFNNRKNYATLNIGKSQGVQRDMAVISSIGIIGSVKDVSEHYATVITLLHKDFKVNCMLKDGSCGPLSWDGESKSILQMEDVPLHAKIKVGDTVYTSHLSHIFPMKLPVGKVLSYERKQKNSFYTVQVEIFTDFSSIQNIFVVKQIYKNEKDSLEKISYQIK